MIFKRISSLIGHIQTHFIDEFFTGSSTFDLGRNFENSHQYKTPKKSAPANPVPKKKVKARKHPCPVPQCSKIFDKKSQLDRHSLKHSLIKKHICQICNKAFSQRSSLKLHIMIHSQIRNWKCIKCPLIFSQKGNMRKHMKNVHSTALSSESDSLKLRCNNCSCSFKNVGALNKHITKIHSGCQSVSLGTFKIINS